MVPLKYELTLPAVVSSLVQAVRIKVDEIALPIENSNLYLPCGITGWITND